MALAALQSKGDATVEPPYDVLAHMSFLQGVYPHVSNSVAGNQGKFSSLIEYNGA